MQCRLSKNDRVGNLLTENGAESAADEGDEVEDRQPNDLSVTQAVLGGDSRTASELHVVYTRL